MTLSFGSLFTGIGGFDLALERAGMRASWQVEIDTKCREVLDRHWPAVPKFSDVQEVTPTECERLQGFPDGWTDNCNDTARYTQLGNAVTVPVIEWIGRRLVAA